jgi:hypothetical protein
LWYDTTNQQLKVWTGAAFLVVGPGYTSAQGTSGAIPQTILSSVGATRYITSLYINNVRVAIVYDGAAFVPEAGLQAAFPTIYPGITLSASVSGAVFAGTLQTAAQPNITTVGTLGNLAVSGQANVTQQINTARVSATGNITGGNLLTGGLILATGNVTAGNLDAINLVINSIRSDDSSFVTIEDGVNISSGAISSQENLSLTANAYTWTFRNDGIGLVLPNSATIRDTSIGALAIGYQAGFLSQANTAVAIGYQAGLTSQGAGAVAIGRSAGNSQSDYAVAIGS